MSGGWDPDAIQAAIDNELRGVITEGGDVLAPASEDVAKKKLRDAAAFAAHRIVHIACYSENEARSLDAAKYIIDRVMGKTTDVPLSLGVEEDMLHGLITTAYDSVK